MKVNKAAEELCLQNPELLSDRVKLLELSKERVHEEGYQYRKGASRSKRLQCDTKQKGTTPKRPKISEDVRLRRISQLEEDIKDATDQIKIKEKRRSLASTAHQYKDCDRLTSQISSLRQKLRENQSELIQIQKKQRKSKWYKDRRTGRSDQSTPTHGATTRISVSPSPTPSSSSLSITPSPAPVEVPCSSGFRTPPPVKSPQRCDSRSSLTSLSPMTSPSPFTSPVFSSSESEFEGFVDRPHEHSSDTVILSSEAESADEKDSQTTKPLVSNSRNSTCPMDNGKDSSDHFQ